MNRLSQLIVKVLSENGLITALVVIGLLMLISDFFAKRVFRGRIHSSAIAIVLGVVTACIAGAYTGGANGVADVGVFAGFGVLGGSAIRDFVITSTAYGAEWTEIKSCGMLGILSVIVGVVISYIVGAVVAYTVGYRDAVSITTIAAGSVTFVVGPVTGTAIGASSTVIAISVVAGLTKSIAVMLLTPFVAKTIGLSTPKMAMIYGGLIGSVSGITAGLSATDPKLVSYGAMTASFYTGIGCLLCPSILFGLTNLVVSL